MFSKFRSNRVGKITLRVVAVLGVLAIAGIADDDFEVVRSMEIFGRVYIDVNKAYVDETSPTALMKTGITAMLSSLDPYTNFYSESLIEDSRVRFSGQLGGVGMEIGLQAGVLQVLSLEKDGPAAKAGVMVGDQLLGIDQELVSNMDDDQEKIDNLLTGQTGSTVLLQVLRQGEKLSLPTVRAVTNTDEQNVRYASMINDSTGYVKLVGFNPNAGADVSNAVKKLKADHAGMTSVVLDLRGNPGGILGEAVNICNVFVPKNEKIVEMKGRSPESNRSFSTMQAPVFTDMRLAIIINDHSASASEIVSGALQDLDRGVVIGRKSYGKGLVQNVRPLIYNTQMKLTIARYYTPSGRCIQAIQYSQQGASAGKSQGVFYTRNGRTVYDAGGIDPDLRVPEQDVHPVTQALIQQGMLFAFANEYAANHPAPASPRSFAVSTEMYDSFINYLKDKGFEFSTHTEMELNNLETLARKQGNSGLNAQLQSIKASLEQKKANDLITHQSEISWHLRREIVRRYFFQDGVFEASFDDDPDLIAANSLLADPVAYRKILQGK